MVRWDKVVVALVLGVIPNQMQCLLSCMNQAGPKAAPAVPACHHHKSDSEKQSPTPCSPDVVVNAAVFTSAQEGMEATPTNASMSLHAEVALLMPNPRGETASFHSLPPGSQFAVLRI